MQPLFDQDAIRLLGALHQVRDKKNSCQRESV